MSRTKKWLLLIGGLLIIIQFIQPVHNKSKHTLETDILKTYVVPDSVRNLLTTACYDCHSNNTRYPWYSYIQPIGWILSNHVQNGKKDLNFSGFGSYSIRRQQSKLKSIMSQINDGSMPLSSYALMHKNARLTKEVRKFINHWAQQSIDSHSDKK